MKTDTGTHRIYREPFHYRHRSFFVGLFVLIPLVLIPAVLLYTLIKADFMQSKATLYANFGQGGLKRGDVVKIQGEKVGDVRRVTLNRQGRVDVELAVQERYLDLIRGDSRAVLQQKNFFVGDWEIDITIGSEIAGPVGEGDTLQGGLKFDVALTLRQVTDMVGAVDSVMKSISQGEGLLGRLLAEDTLADVAVGFAYKLDRLVDEVNGVLRNANGMIDRLALMGDRGVETLDTLKGFAQGADTLVGELRRVSANLDALVGDLGSVPDDFGEVMVLLKREVVEMEVLLKALQRHWLFRRSVRKVREEEETRR